MTDQTQDLFRAFRRFGQLSRRLAWQQPQPPHHHGQARILRVIANEDEPNSARLAEILDIRPSSVSELLKKLEDAGLITREPDPDDKRASKIHMTPAGEAKLKEAEQAQTDFADKAFSGLSDEEQQQLLALLTKTDDALAGQVKDTPDFPDDPRFGGRGMHHHGPWGDGMQHHGPHGFGRGEGFPGRPEFGERHIHGFGEQPDDDEDED
ncbi:MarR family winged helix-turn-helix transcriptional regulator [Schleiferilactobacillus shenzhenensis]|uniref:HTH marR-type domain-containing protein n=1 Tax=Schleiferilactobacillus shenzhenensis LY-73 TaxID=1231336 RepID=U4TMC2_9LACO|nr:MarR family winged helix-turn-helix transcriptional regulator [Schleiferilactobacillus shenzhenensis]ERL66031.1 hypothetical protein L248_1123 [Schleiferilactobacillus shenzhenensis LY-73]